MSDPFNEIIIYVDIESLGSSNEDQTCDNQLPENSVHDFESISPPNFSSSDESDMDTGDQLQQADVSNRAVIKS